MTMAPERFSTGGTLESRGKPVLSPFGEWLSERWISSIPPHFCTTYAYRQVTG